jgi:hypothetical protein
LLETPILYNKLTNYSLLLDNQQPSFKIMKIHNKEDFKKENDRFEVIGFDKDRYEKSKRIHLFYLLRCKKCGHIISRKKDLITSNFDNLECDNCLFTRNGSILNVLEYRIYTYYKHNAETRNISWNLSEEEFKSLIYQNCEYCGEKPSMYRTAQYKNKTIYYNGIDRIDSSVGYTIENCVPCCDICNRMKNKYSVDIFLNKIKQIYNHCFIEGSTTISKESTSQANGDGNGEHLEKDEDIV